MAAPIVSSAESIGIDSPYRWVMLAGIWLIYFSFGLVIASLAPLVNTIVADLQISLSQMGGILGAWQLVYLIAALPLGIALDRLGVRTCLLLSAIIIALSVIARGFAHDGFTLWLSVAFFGFGGPLISIGAPKVIASWFGSTERGLAMGIYMTGPAIGGVASLSLTNSVLMPLFDYQWSSVFFLFGAVTLFSAIVWIVINAAPASHLANERSENAVPQKTLQVFVQLLRIPVVVIILLMSIGIFTINHGIMNWLPAILRSTGMTASQAGFWAAIPTLAGVIGSLTIPALATPQRRYLILIGLFCSMLMAIVLINIASGSLLAGGLIMQGLARSSMMTIAILILMEIPEVGAKNIGIAGGLFFTAAEIGGVLGPLGIGIITERFGGFHVALWALCGVCVLLIVLGNVLRCKTR